MMATIVRAGAHTVLIVCALLALSGSLLPAEAGNRMAPAADHTAAAGDVSSPALSAPGGDTVWPLEGDFEEAEAEAVGRVLADAGLLAARRLAEPLLRPSGLPDIPPEPSR
jgi:hypothetical protein